DISLTEWLEKEVGNSKKKETVVAFDPWIVTQSQRDSWENKTKTLPIVWTSFPNLVDRIWQDRPAFPAGEVMLQPIELAGATYETKRAELLAAMEKKKADRLILTAPDAINWLLNIRGDDIPFNPLLLCYFILAADGSATLYSYERSFNDKILKYFKENEIGL